MPPRFLSWTHGGMVVPPTKRRSRPFRQVKFEQVGGYTRPVKDCGSSQMLKAVMGNTH